MNSAMSSMGRSMHLSISLRAPPFFKLTSGLNVRGYCADIKGTSVLSCSKSVLLADKYVTDHLIDALRCPKGLHKIPFNLLSQFPITAFYSQSQYSVVTHIK